MLEGCDAKPCTQKANAADGAVFLFVRWRRSRGGLRGNRPTRNFSNAFSHRPEPEAHRNQASHHQTVHPSSLRWPACG